MSIVLAVLSTKGGVGKSTTTANLGALLADAGKKVLLIDLDLQPTLTTYFRLVTEAEGGTFNLLAQGETRARNLVSKTSISGLDIIVSNDRNDLLPTLMRNAPDGRIRLRSMLKNIDANYDVVLIDTRGTQSITVELALLAADVALSPVNPEMLVAREFRRGTLQMLDDLRAYSELGIVLPTIQAFLNKVDGTTDTDAMTRSLRSTFGSEDRVRILKTQVPSAVVFRVAATRGEPVHRLEPVKPSNVKREAILDTMKKLAIEVFPQWVAEITAVNKDSFKNHELDHVVEGQDRV